MRAVGEWLKPNRKNTFDNGFAECMLAIFEEVLFTEEVASILIKFPEVAIHDIKLFVAEILCHTVDILFFVDVDEFAVQVGTSQFSQRNATSAAEVDEIEDSHDDCQGILAL